MGIKVPIPTRIGPCYPRCAPTYGQGGRGSRAHRLVSGLLPGEAPVIRNGLLNNLIAYWPGDEASGNALDAHTNGLDLTDINTVTSNPGQVYPLARQYTAATSEYHARPGDDALLSTGDVDFTFAAWVYLDSKAGTTGIGAKLFSSGQFEWGLVYGKSSDRFVFLVSNDGTALTSEAADVLGSPSTSTWYLVVAWHDAVNDTINIQVNNGAVDSQNYAAGVHDGSSPFTIGRYSTIFVWDGRIGPSMFWKSAGGGGGVLTAAQRTSLYNAGAGLPYTSFTL